ncbi:transposase [Leptospira vanthielii]|uniref:Transposase domain protein n=1 Tax=Leptospira vanthielii serovar Holland str. Waz Holland = ATCC 700522 TaxID=1218591 RepID=N1VYC7_9LEPT|nr:transposase domain protein [Leptospira vanthielii serovar Holland str. Waz Holland = ATCC 700522]
MLSILIRSYFLDNGSINLHNKDKSFSFSNHEFVNRYIKHIIPQNIKSIRYSGFYSSASKSKYDLVNQLFIRGVKKNQNQKSMMIRFSMRIINSTNLVLSAIKG